MNETKQLEVVVMTGLSGAGKTTAVNALEDLGYFCVDNLPTPVIVSTLDALAAAGEKRVALGVDVRGRTYFTTAARVVEQLAGRADVQLSVCFLDASDELLARRYNASRRPHPLTAAGRSEPPALLEGISLERELLAPLRALASVVIDTSELNVHALRRRIFSHYARSGEAGPRLVVRVMSFGFKYGAPHDADLMFDVRFLPNPHFVEALRPRTGLEPEVADFVLEREDARLLLQKVTDLLDFCLPRFAAEGKSYVTIAIGCTGGRHRSVALAEVIAHHLDKGGEARVEAFHRDVSRADEVSNGRRGA